MISIVLATKNGGRFLKKSVESVQKQTLKDFELIIVSDGSTDNTAEISRGLAASDNRIKVLELKENRGPGLARNVAVEMARGEYVALIDDDDAWLSAEKLARQKEYLDEHPDIVSVGAARVEFVRENGAHIFWLNQEKNSSKIRANMLSYNPLITSSVMFRKSIFAKAGGFKPMRLAEDYDLWLRMGKFGGIANIDGAETQYTLRDGGASRSGGIEMCRIVLRLAKEYRHYYPRYIKALIKGYARLVLIFIKNILK